MLRAALPPALVVAVSILVSAAPAMAHEGDVGFSEITVDGDTVLYDLYLDLTELTTLRTRLPFGPEGDTAVDEAGELRVHDDDVLRLVRDGLSVSAGGRTADPELVEVRRTDLAALGHLVEVGRMEPVPLLSVQLRYAFDRPVSDLRVAYDLFLQRPGQQPHVNVAWLHLAGVTSTYVFSPQAPVLTPERVTPLYTAAPSEPLTAPADAGSGGLCAAPVAIAAGLAVSGATGALLRRRARRGALIAPGAGGGRR